MNRRIAWAIALAGVLMLPGCAGGSDPWKEPDSSVEKVAHDLAAGRVEVAWEALPESYRADVQSVIRDGAAKLDAEVWNTTFVALGKVGRILEEKRDFLLANPMLAGQQDNLPQIEMAIDGLATVIRTLSSSEIGDLEQLARLDVGEFLAGTGSKLMDQLRAMPAAEGEESMTAALEKLAATSATVVSRDGERATLRIEAPDEDPQEQVWVQVDGRWVPESMASSWDAEMQKIRDGIAQAEAAMAPDRKQAVMMQLAMVNGVLDRLLATQTAEEFNQQVGALLGLAMGAMMNR